LLIVGEAPGANEDKQGEPFVGRAGALLDKLFARAGIKREDTFITNIVKCRPPGNRDPEPEEIAACLPYLLEQIERVRPRVIVALGRFAAQRLTGQWGQMGALMGLADMTFHHPDGKFDPIPVMVLYHPSYLLRMVNSKKANAKDVLSDSVTRLQSAWDLALPF